MSPSAVRKLAGVSGTFCSQVLDILWFLLSLYLFRTYHKTRDAIARTDLQLRYFLDQGPRNYSDLRYDQLKSSDSYLSQRKPHDEHRESLFEIRLFTLLPGRGYDPIVGELQKKVFDSTLRYEALSYCWGDSNDPILNQTLIEISDCKFRVTQNLKEALRFLRSETSERLLWIDAICINQSNDEEKTVQISRMRDIFERAERVVVWLGPEAENTAATFDLCKMVVRDANLQEADSNTSIEVVENPYFPNFPLSTLDIATQYSNIDLVDAIKRYELFWTSSRGPGLFWKSISCGVLKVAMKREFAGIFQKMITTPEYPSRSNRAPALRNLVKYIATTDNINHSSGILGVSKLISEHALPSTKLDKGEPTDVRASELYVPELGDLHVTYDSSESWRSVRQVDLLDIARRDWVSRVWTLPEAAIARKLVVQSGQSQIDWESFATGLRFLMTSRVDFSPANYYSPQGAESLLSTADIRNTYQRFRGKYLSNKPMELLQLLHTFRTRQSSDARDKVYAYLGLANSSLDIIPDYSKSVTDVYKKTASTLLKHCLRLELLSVPHGRRPSAQTALPSWVPDWSNCSSSLPLPLTPSLNQHKDVVVNSIFQSYAASGDSSSSYPQIHDDRLTLSGYPVDVIQSTSVTMPRVQTQRVALISEVVHLDVWNIVGRYSDRAALKARVLHALVEQERFVSQRGLDARYATGEEVQTAYAKTLFPAWSESSMLDVRLSFDGVEVNPKHDPSRALFMDLHLTDRSKHSILYLVKYVLYSVLKSYVLKTPQPRYRHDLEKDVLTDSMPHIAGRKLAWTEGGYLAAVSPHAEPGDQVFLLKSGAVPYILRPVEKTGTWLLLGDAYVHGMMFGERWDEGLCHEVQIQ